MSADSPGIYDQVYVNLNDYARHRRAAKSKAAALGHQMSYFIAYIGNGPGRRFASNCHICEAMLIEDRGTRKIEGPALVVTCHR